MKNLFPLFFLLSITAFSQPQKIKVKKALSEIKQSELPFLVTICNKYSGTITKKELCANPQLIIANNSSDLRIINYEMMYQSRGKLVLYSNMTNDAINEQLIKNIMSCDKNKHVVFQDIKAVSKNNDTIFLNPISLKIED